MNPFSTAPDFILDLIFLKLSEEDLHETLRVSKSWFLASIRRIKSLEIYSSPNPLELIAAFYNKHRGLADDELDWHDLFKYLNLDELYVDDDETTKFLFNNGCNTVSLEICAEKNREVTLASLKTFARLQSFEYRIYDPVYNDAFLSECFKAFDSAYGPFLLQIKKIKLTSDAWKSEDQVLKSVTQIRVNNVNIDFLRTLIDHCPNLEEIRCGTEIMTTEWNQIFPPNIKRIRLHTDKLDKDLATIVNASTDSGRQLLPYLCQNWESVEKFKCSRSSWCNYGFYKVFPQQREEIFKCAPDDNLQEMNFASQHFKCQGFRVRCDCYPLAKPIIPPTKRVKFRFLNMGPFDFSEHEFSPMPFCLEPHQVDHLTITWGTFPSFTYRRFAPNSFEGFVRLTSLALSHVSVGSIMMALDQCPSIRKLKLKHLKAKTIGKMAGRGYRNVSELVLKECQEAIHKVFKVFPCLSEFALSIRYKEELLRETTDFLSQHLVRKVERFGVLYLNSDGLKYTVSNGLHSSLNRAQEFVSRNNVECYLKGFKFSQRNAGQKVFYID